MNGATNIWRFFNNYPTTLGDRLEGPQSTTRPPLRPTVRLDIAGHTDRGFVRTRNEDNFLALHIRVSNTCSSSCPVVAAQTSDVALLVVADGLGGHRGGHLASETVVRHFANVGQQQRAQLLDAVERGEDAVEDLLALEFQRCHAKLLLLAEAYTEYAGMASTATVAIVAGSRLFVCHAGDSRCYVVSHESAKRLTTDHTLANQFGLDTEMSDQSWLHTMWNAVGGDDEPVVADFQSHTLEPDDRVLLCTDGLTKHLTDEQILEIMTTSSPSHGTCSRLIEEALIAGGSDNIATVVACAAG